MPNENSSPLQISNNVTYPKLVAPIFGAKRRGKFVSVRPAGEEKTYLGIYMGDMPRLDAKIDDKAATLSIWRTDKMGNPAIYVPDLGQIIYGMESWWGEISTPDDLKQITDADIENVWYVQALKSLDAKAEEPAPAN